MTTARSLIQSDRPISTGALAIYPDTPQRRNTFRGVPRFGDPFDLWQPAGPGLIGVPRAVCPIGLKDERVSGEAVEFGCNFVARNPEQQRGADEGRALALAGRSWITEAPTGSGKTILGCVYAAALQRKTLVVVTKEDLIGQWNIAAQKVLGVSTSRIGLIRQDAMQVKNRDFVVALVHSLAIPGRYPEWMRRLFGTVIFDEVHRMGAETFSQVCGMFPARTRIGLSAQSSRQDGKEVIFQSHIGPVAIVLQGMPMTPKVIRFETGWKCPRTMRDEGGYNRVIRVPHAAGKTGHIIARMCKDDARNAILANATAELYRRGRKVVFFSEHVEMLSRMRPLLVARGVPGPKIGEYWGQPSHAEVERAKGSPVVLATYRKMGEGTDWPWLDATVLGTPMAHVKQPVGRVVREYPDKETPIVVDPIDDDSPVFAGYARTRARFYASMSAEVLDVMAPAS